MLRLPGILFITVALVGCGTLKFEGQVLHPEEATATQIAATMNSQVTATPLARNVSPITFPTSQICQITFFWGPMPGLCPSKPSVDVEGAFQVYDGGYMLWEHATGSVYILYNGSLGRRIEESTIGGWPEIQLQIAPPPNHVPPVRGFGRVWQHEQEIRERLGWPLGLEQSYTAQFQASGETTSNQYFYVSIPNGQVVEFNSAGTWRVVK